MPVNARPSRTRAFSLLEILFAIGLVSVIMLVATRQFGTMFKVMDKVPAASDQAIRFDAMLTELRRDVWQAQRVSVSDGRTLKTDAVTWAINDEGQFSRNSGDASRQFSVAEPKCRFIDEQGTFLLSTADDRIVLIHPRLAGRRPQ